VPGAPATAAPPCWREANPASPLANRIDPRRLNELERRVPEESLKQALQLQSGLAMESQL